MAFEKATKQKSFGRITVCGLSGAGKTYTSLALATLMKGDGKVAVVDTESGRSRLLSDVFEFDIAEMPAKPDPREAVKHMREAESEGYTVVVVDSATPLWQTTLDLKQQMEKRQGVNSFTAWNEAGGIFQEFWDTVNQLQCHVIVTLRQKMKHELIEDDNGRKKVEKLGLGAITRDGTEYEADTNIEIERDSHDITIEKSRISSISGKHFQGGDVTELAEILIASLTEGADPPPRSLTADEQDVVRSAFDNAARRLGCEIQAISAKVLDLLSTKKIHAENMEQALFEAERLALDDAGNLVKGDGPEKQGDEPEAGQQEASQ